MRLRELFQPGRHVVHCADCCKRMRSRRVHTDAVAQVCGNCWQAPGRAPARIQRQRTKGWQMPPGAVYVGRPTVFGNPFTVRDARFSHNAVTAYECWAAGKIELVGALLLHDLVQLHPRYRRFWKLQRPDVSELRGRDLCCWCPLSQPCHADVILRIANR